MKTVNKILITGGAGYIGNELIKALPKETGVVVIDNFHIDTEHKRAINRELAQRGNVTVIEANVSEVDKYKDAIKDIDVLIYMASLNVYKEANANPLMYLEGNNISLQKLLNELKDSSPNLSKILLTSTRGVYGEGAYLCNACQTRVYPMLSEELTCTECSSTYLTPQKLNEKDMVNPSSYYGVTKKIQEDILSMYSQMNSIPMDIFRIFNVYGEDQGKYYSTIGIIPQMYEQITKKGEVYFSGSGQVTRDFVHVADIVEIFLKSIFSGAPRKNLREVYNLGSGQGVSINDIANFFESLGHTFKKNVIKEFGDIKYSVADNSKVSKAFGIEKFRDMYDFLSASYKKVE